MHNLTWSFSVFLFQWSYCFLISLRFKSKNCSLLGFLYSEQASCNKINVKTLPSYAKMVIYDVRVKLTTYFRHGMLRHIQKVLIISVIKIFKKLYWWRYLLSGNKTKYINITKVFCNYICMCCHLLVNSQTSFNSAKWIDNYRDM